jgi:electron transport complex protein RnfB
MSAGPRRVAASELDAVLPQTQCTRCGYAGCLPYATAIAAGEAAINQCPPGGAATIAALAERLRLPALPLNPLHGVEAPPVVAWIDETRCIGCAKCLPPCPVDAIVGAAKFMHTVLVDRCTGCELCVAPCPVDCIELRPAPTEDRPTPAMNRARHAAHSARTAARLAARQRELAAKKAAAPRGTDAPA